MFDRRLGEAGWQMSRALCVAKVYYQWTQPLFKQTGSCVEWKLACLLTFFPSLKNILNRAEWPKWPGQLLRGGDVAALYSLNVLRTGYPTSIGVHAAYRRGAVVQVC